MFNKSSGFTLIELLVVVLIIGILAAVAVPQYQKAVEKGRLAEALQNAKVIQNCYELYILERGLPSDTDWKPLQSCSVDLNLEQNGDDQIYYYSKYFSYAGIACSSEGCGVEVDRKNGDTFVYLLSLYVTPSGTEKNCWTYQTDIGRYICKSVESLGWNYVDDIY